MESKLLEATLKAIGLLSQEQKAALCRFLEAIDTNQCDSCYSRTVSYSISTYCSTCGSSTCVSDAAKDQ